MARQVWLGNSRGNTYARRHISLDSSSDAFWDFTWWDSSQRCLDVQVMDCLRQACTCAMRASSHARVAEEGVSVSTAGI